MEYIVLGLLLIGNMTIYELNASFKQGLSLIYSASYGNLQYAVKKLLKEKLVAFTETVENGRNKKVYRINEKGKEHFFKWMYAETPLNRMETVILSKIYFLGLVESGEDRLRIIEEMISRAAGVEKDLREYKDEITGSYIPEQYVKIAKYQFSTLDYGIMAHRTAVDWLKELLEEIKRK